MKTKRDCDVIMAMDSGCEVDSDPSRICDTDSGNNCSDNDSDSESSSIYADDRNEALSETLGSSNVVCDMLVLALWLGCLLFL